MGRLSNSSLFSFQTKKCACALFQKESFQSCCKDERELIALDIAQSQTPVVSVSAPQLFELGGLFSSVLVLPISSFEDRTPVFHSDSSPPGRGPLFKLHCSFVFYG